MSQVHDQDIGEELGAVWVFPGVSEAATRVVETSIIEDFWDDRFSVRDLARSNTEKLEAEANAGLRRGSLAGKQLWCLYDLVHASPPLTDEPSLAKVHWLISERLGSRGPGEDALKKAWTAAGSVSHLIAGLEYCRAWLIPNSEHDPSLSIDAFEDRLIGYWLSAARAFQEFILTWERPRSSVTNRLLVAEEDLWTIPSELALPDIGALDVRSFSDCDRELVENFERRPRGDS